MNFAGGGLSAAAPISCSNDCARFSTISASVSGLCTKPITFDAFADTPFKTRTRTRLPWIVSAISIFADRRVRQSRILLSSAAAVFAGSLIGAVTVRITACPFGTASLMRWVAAQGHPR